MKPFEIKDHITKHEINLSCLHPQTLIITVLCGIAIHISISLCSLHFDYAVSTIYKAMTIIPSNLYEPQFFLMRTFSILEYIEIHLHRVIYEPIFHWPAMNPIVGRQEKTAFVIVHNNLRKLLEFFCKMFPKVLILYSLIWISFRHACTDEPGYLYSILALY